MDEDSKKISSLLEEQKRKREMIQKRKELARQKLAEEKRKELETKIKTEGILKCVVFSLSLTHIHTLSHFFLKKKAFTL